MTLDVEVEIEGRDRPAMVAAWLAVVPARRTGARRSGCSVTRDVGSGASLLSVRLGLSVNRWRGLASGGTWPRAARAVSPPLAPTVSSSA